eukprot:Colp12_sorted_trinity150504_noHs@32465
MSFIGRTIIRIPNTVKYKMGTFAGTNHKYLAMTGTYGAQWLSLPKGLNLKIEPGNDEVPESRLTVHPTKDLKDKAMWGTTVSLIHQMCTGVNQGFSKQLKLVGVGYRASVGPLPAKLPPQHEVKNVLATEKAQDALFVKLGFSNTFVVPLPSTLKVECSPKGKLIRIFGNSLAEVSNACAKVIAFRPASKDPYKGKGVRLTEKSKGSM